jgi:hypothetical protein
MNELNMDTEILDIENGIINGNLIVDSVTYPFTAKVQKGKPKIEFRLRDTLFLEDYGMEAVQEKVEEAIKGHFRGLLPRVEVKYIKGSKIKGIAYYGTEKVSFTAEIDDEGKVFIDKDQLVSLFTGLSDEEVTDRVDELEKAVAEQVGDKVLQSSLLDDKLDVVVGDKKVAIFDREDLHNYLSYFGLGLKEDGESEKFKWIVRGHRIRIDRIASLNKKSITFETTQPNWISDVEWTETQDTDEEGKKKVRESPPVDNPRLLVWVDEEDKHQEKLDGMKEHGELLFDLRTNQEIPVKDLGTGTEYEGTEDDQESPTFLFKKRPKEKLPEIYLEIFKQVEEEPKK